MCCGASWQVHFLVSQDSFRKDKWRDCISNSPSRGEEGRNMWPLASTFYQSQLAPWSFNGDVGTKWVLVGPPPQCSRREKGKHCLQLQRHLDPRPMEEDKSYQELDRPESQASAWIWGDAYMESGTCCFPLSCSDKCHHGKEAGKKILVKRKLC